VKAILVTIFALMATQTAFADGQTGSGGGFADRNGHAALKQAKAHLAFQMRTFPKPQLFNIPTGWTVEKISSVAENIEERPLDLREREGRPLVFDFNTSTEKIMALGSFFQSYGSLPEGQLLAPAQLRDLESKILHEISHLWGADEAQADVWSAGILGLFDLDVLICRPQITDFDKLLLVSKWGLGGYAARSVLVSPEIEEKGLRQKGISSNLFKRSMANPVKIISSEINDNGSMVIHFSDSPTSPWPSPTLTIKNGVGLFKAVDGETWKADCKNSLVMN